MDPATRVGQRLERIFRRMESVQVLRIEPGDALLVRAKSDDHEEVHQLYQAARAVLEQMGVKVPIVVIGPTTDIQVLRGPRE